MARLRLATAKEGLSHGTFVSIQDFSENIHQRVRYEPQSKHYTQVSSTLYVVVIRFHLDDANNIPIAQKGEVRALFIQLGWPVIIVETHCFVSSDLTHDN
eukprot:4414718-Pleurochrysis_carterae.AAC.1